MLVYFVLILQQLLASGTHIVAKIVARDVEPLTLTMLRSLIAAGGLLLYMKLKKTSFNFEKSDYKKLAFLSFLAIPVNQFLFLFGMRYSTPANAALLYGCTPAVVLLLSYGMKKERMTFKKGLGVALALFGCVLIVFERGIDFSSDYTFGNLLFVIAVIAWGMYTVYGKILTLKYGAFSTSAATMIFGCLMFVPFGAIGIARFDFSTLTLVHWGGLVYLAIATSVLSYYLWYYALERIEASKVAIFTNLQPVATTILSVLLLDQHITPTFIVGGALALAGVIVTQFS